MLHFTTLFQLLITSILLTEQLAYATYIPNELERGLVHPRRQYAGACSLDVTVTKVFILVPVGPSERRGLYSIFANIIRGRFISTIMPQQIQLSKYTTT